MQMFKKLFVPRLNSLSFTDWVNRVNDSLINSYSEVEASKREDSFENVLDVFKRRSFDLLNAIDGIELFVDIYGVFLYNDYSDKKVYVLSFDKNGRFTNLPTEPRFTSVTVRKHLVSVLTKEYEHYFSKLADRHARLTSEIKETEELMVLVERKISKIGVRDTAQATEPKNFDTLETFVERSSVSHTPDVGVSVELKKPAAKKKSPTKKKTSKK